MSDGARFYLDAGTGEILARRTRWGYFYAWMWGLHIMDLKTREDAHNPLIGFAAVSLATVLLTFVLLSLTLKRLRR